MKIIKVGFILILFLSCKKENFVPVVGFVVEKNTQNAIPNAKILFNATETFLTNSDGKFSTEYDLGKYIADSISFYVTKDGFDEKQYSALIGNVQKDVIIIELEYE